LLDDLLEDVVILVELLLAGMTPLRKHSTSIVALVSCVILVEG